MRAHPRRSPLRPLKAAAALGGLLGLSGCLDVFAPVRPPPDPREIARNAFGREALAWFTPDSAGAGTMVPELSGAHVYFERDMYLVSGGDILSPAQLVALDRGSGQVAWQGPINTAGNAAVARGVVGAVWGSLMMFDQASGAPVHTYRFGTTSLSSNVVSDGSRFYVATHDGHAVAVDPATGEAAWTTRLAQGPVSPGFGVTLSGEVLAVAVKHFGTGPAAPDSGIVAVLDRATGAVRWRAALQGAADPGIVSPPAIVDGVVVVVTQGHDVRAFDLQTGAPRWQADVSFAAQEFASDGLAACEGLVIVPTGELGLAALDAATGALRWRLRDIEEGSLHGVQCAHGTAMTVGNRVTLFDARTGALRVAHPRDPTAADPGFWITAATRDEAFLYVATSIGYAKVRVP